MGRRRLRGFRRQVRLRRSRCLCNSNPMGQLRLGGFRWRVRLRRSPGHCNSNPIGRLRPRGLRRPVRLLRSRGHCNSNPMRRLRPRGLRRPVRLLRSRGHCNSNPMGQLRLGGFRRRVRLRRSPGQCNSNPMGRLRLGGPPRPVRLRRSRGYCNSNPMRRLRPRGFRRRVRLRRSRGLCNSNPMEPPWLPGIRWWRRCNSNPNGCLWRYRPRVRPQPFSREFRLRRPRLVRFAPSPHTPNLLRHLRMRPFPWLQRRLLSWLPYNSNPTAYRCLLLLPVLPRSRSLKTSPIPSRVSLGASRNCRCRWKRPKESRLGTLRMCGSRAPRAGRRRFR